MGTRVTQHPAIPHPTMENILEVVRAMKESLEIGRHDKRGDPLDQWVTRRELNDLGLTNIFDESTYNSGGAGPGLGDGGGDPGNVYPVPPGDGNIFLPPFDPDYPWPLPDRPQNVRTNALWDSIMVKWDWPDQDGVAWKGAIVWMSATPFFSEGNFLGHTQSNFYILEDVGLSASEPPERWFWVAWFSVPGEGGATYNPEDIPGVGRRSEWSPYEYQEGVKGTTALDPEYVLRVLKDQITEAEIYDILNKRIDLVDYNPENPLEPFETSVQERILAASLDANGTFYTAIAQQARASIEQNPQGYVASGDYSLRIDAGGYITGFGLSSMATLDEDGNIRETTSSFQIRAESFAIVSPIQPKNVYVPGAGFLEPDTAIPFVVGKVDGNWTVGIDGQLVVDGTITANSIQAGEIGAREISAESVWAGLMTADKLISAQMRTNPYPNVRLEINGAGTDSEEFPLWFGWGHTQRTSDEFSQPAFFFTNRANLHLAGDMYITGRGHFYIGGAEDTPPTTWEDTYRIEFGGWDNEFLMWVGRGEEVQVTDWNPNDPALSGSSRKALYDKWIMYIDKAGNMVTKGLIEARFVSGELSRTNVLTSASSFSKSIKRPSSSQRTDDWPYSESAWVRLFEENLPGSVFDPHLPTINISLELHSGPTSSPTTLGATAAAVRIWWMAPWEGRYGTNGVWQELVRTVADLSAYGGSHHFQANAPKKVKGECYFRVEIGAFDTRSWAKVNSTLYCTGYNGYLFGIR